MSQRYRIPSLPCKRKVYPEIKVEFRTVKEGFAPYLRDENLKRPWAIPGTPGLEHRIGGLEKSNITGNVNYDPGNHEFMVHLRAQKIKNIENDIPELEVTGDKDADVLVIGWGGTFGSISEAVSSVRQNGGRVAQAHFKYLNPFPKNTGEILKRYRHIICAELNMGQLAKFLKSEYPVVIDSFTKIQGLPFKSSEIENKILKVLGEIRK